MPCWGPFRSLLFLSPLLIGVPWLALTQHRDLPKPLTELFDPVTSLPQLSEARILAYAKHLSEGIGYRTVGTYEHAVADRWMVEQAEGVKRMCEDVVRKSGGTRKLECEVWRQQGSGSHRFDMMGKRLYKTYVDLTNIVVRISDGTPESKAHSVLVNSHLDSTLPSPGAADDALPVGVMLECMRVLVQTEEWEPKHAIVFLFNNAEESLQDGSHLFSTQHPIASTVRAVINLEAAGTTGREILFQATSEEMIEAYSHVPRPFGTIFANDIFSSGIILSDTDFRQFEQYLNVTGLDMAIVGNSYLYHMRKDLVENIQPGVAQNMAMNTLALLQHLSTSPSSPLPTLTTYTRPTTVFFSYLGAFFIYSFRTAKILYSALLAASILFLWMHGGDGDGEDAKGKGTGVWRSQLRGMKFVLAGLGGCVLSANVVALLLKYGLGKGMSWFSNEMVAVAGFGCAGLFGALLSQFVLTNPSSSKTSTVSEHTLFSSLLLIQSFAALVIQLIGIGSAAIFFLSAFPLFIALLLNPLFLSLEGRASGNGNGKRNEIALMTYAVGQAFPLFGGVLLLVPVVEVFVPLTGRIGADAPADNIIASIVSAIGALALPLAIPFAHRFGRGTLGGAVRCVGVVLVGVVAWMAGRNVFDDMHQKRVFVLHLENITSSERHLHIASADGASGFEGLVKDMVHEFAAPDVRGNAEALVPVAMDEYTSDWDIIYPFSNFLTSYKVPLAIEPGYVSPWTEGGERGFSVVAVEDVRDFGAGTRRLRLKVYHPGLIWTVIAFDAHVLEWNLDGQPPNEHARHHVREASFYGSDAWTLDLVIRIPPDGGDGGLLVNFIGLQENGMWPGKKAVKAEGGAAMALFEVVDEWVERRTGGAVDAMLVGGVAGIVRV